MARGYATLYGFGSSEPMGTDETLAANFAPSAGGSWLSDLAGSVFSNAPMAVEKLPNAYAAYEAGGGGVEGALAIFPVFGPQATPQKPIPSVSVLPTASQVAAKEEGGSGLPSLGVIGGVLAVGGLLWYATRKKR